MANSGIDVRSAAGSSCRETGNGARMKDRDAPYVECRCTYTERKPKPSDIDAPIIPDVERISKPVTSKRG